MHLEGQALLVGFEPGDIFFGHAGQFGIGRLGLEQGAVIEQIGQAFEIGLAVGDQVFEPGVFFGQLLGALRVVKGFGIAQSSFDFGKTAGEFFDLGPKVHLSWKKRVRPSGRGAARAEPGKSG